MIYLVMLAPGMAFLGLKGSVLCVAQVCLAMNGTVFLSAQLRNLCVTSILVC